MPTADQTLHRAQPGLLFVPRHGAFILGWLGAAVTPAAAVEALRTIVAGASAQHGFAVVGVAASVWSRHAGASPAGAPPARPIVASDPSFHDSGADLWVYLKARSAADLVALVELADRALAPVVERSETVEGHLSDDAKILDRHFVDGVTSPSDPLGIAESILQRPAGGCWALAQQFRFDWDAFGALSVNGQEDVIGRDGNGVLIPQRLRRSHVKRVRALADDHTNLALLRQALPYGRDPSQAGREAGLYFAAFAQDCTTFESLLARMAGRTASGTTDALLDMTAALAGGYFYVPSALELGVDETLHRGDVELAGFWKQRSPNGVMFYNSADYLHAMGCGDYEPGDPPSDRILGLVGKIFTRWQNRWYETLDTPRIPSLGHVLRSHERSLLDSPVVVRRALSIDRMLTRIWTTDELPLGRESWAWRADLFRVDPNDVLAGVMPQLSLGRGREIMEYLTDEERLAGFLVPLDETSSMGHVVPDHATLLARGIGGLLDELRMHRAGAVTEARMAFYDAAIIALEGVQGYCRNYAALAAHEAQACPDAELRRNLEALAARMGRLASDPPSDLLEAAQALFTMHCCLHLTGEPVSIGRLDQLLAPFADGVSDEDAQEILDALWVKLAEKALHNRQNAADHLTYGTSAVSYSAGNFGQGDGINQWVQQVTVGGYLPTDDAEPVPGANRLTLLCLRASRRLPLNAPVLSLRVYPGMPDEIIEEAARAIRSGGSHPILFQEDRMVGALSGYSRLPLRFARDYVCDGCYEPLVAGRSEFAFGNVTALDALELALNEGATLGQAGPIHLRGWKVSFRSPKAGDIGSFGQLQDLYLAHLRYLVVQFLTRVLGNYGGLWKYCPSPLLSTLIDGCVESGRDLSDGGARVHILCPMFVALATTIDSLYAIKKLVFDEATASTTLPELLEALQQDWGFAMSEPFQSTLAGPGRAADQARRYQELRARALALPRFGSGCEEVDALGGWLVDHAADLVRELFDDPPAPLAAILARLREQYSLPGRPWEMTLQAGVGTFEAYVGDAVSSGASADGRRSAQPFPSDFSPSPVPQDLAPIAQDPTLAGAIPGTNRPIYTALSSWNQAPMNEKLSNAGPADFNIREDFSQRDLTDFIRRYAAGEVGGNLLTLTCADPDTYAAAAGEPERYELVRVRTGGWTEFFTAMFPAHHDQHRRRPYLVPQPEHTTPPSEAGGGIERHSTGADKR